MNKPPQKMEWSKFPARFQAAPLELKGYAIFAVLVSVGGFLLSILGLLSSRGSLPGLRGIIDSVVPIVGWSASSTGYMFTLFFAFMLICQRLPNWRAMRFFIAMLLLMSSIFDVTTAIRTGNRAHSGAPGSNPYLTVSPWRGVWVCGVPVLWIAVLHSPRVRRFCEPLETAGENDVK
jgi:hypothetical protein